jgi:demethylmenaquinone methyltransferase/2-methoxy-6-polyprenyl-1,4-benzoquinol methylase
MSTTHFGLRRLTSREGAPCAACSTVASKYDLMNDLMSAGLHRAWKAYT